MIYVLESGMPDGVDFFEVVFGDTYPRGRGGIAFFQHKQ